MCMKLTVAAMAATREHGGSGKALHDCSIRRTAARARRRARPSSLSGPSVASQ
jgi:hypothetical protein